MKTQSKSIKILLTAVLLSMTISSIDAQYIYTFSQYGTQEYKPEKTKKRKRKEEDSACVKNHGPNLVHGVFYKSPDVKNLDEITSFAQMDTTYFFGVGEGPSIKIAIKNAKKDFGACPESMQEQMMFFYGYKLEDFKFVIKQTKIDFLGPKKYKVTLWAQYEIVRKKPKL